MTEALSFGVVFFAGSAGVSSGSGASWSIVAFWIAVVFATGAWVSAHG